MSTPLDTAYRIGANAPVGFVLAVAVIGFALRRGLDAPRRWLVAWLVVDALASLAALVFRFTIRNSQYVSQSWYPFSAALAIAVLASTVISPTVRQRVYFTAVVVAALIVWLTFTVETFGDFSRYTGVIHGLTLSVVGSVLVVQRALRARGDMLADPIFLVGVAFLLFGTPSAFVALSAQQLRERDLEWRKLIYTCKNAMALASYLVMVVALYPPGSRRTATLTTASR